MTATLTETAHATLDCGALASTEFQCDARPRPEPLTFVLLTRRDPRTDFRLYLAAALRAAGHACYVVGPFRRSRVSARFSTDTELTLGVLGLLGWMRRLARAEPRLVVIDSLNLGVPLVCMALRLASWPAVWAYDLHDNLLYDLHGPARLLGAVKLRLHHALASFAFHAAPTLAELFPRSHRLGNASHLRRRPGARAGVDQVLILASVDERFDFELVRQFSANRGLTFHIHGGLAEGSTPRTRARIRAGMAMLAGQPNIRYHGAYVNSELERILSGFSVMLAPYKLADRSTRYIEPLRYHHALNNGVAVLTTAIPAALAFGPGLHVVADRLSFERALEAVARTGAREQPEVTWEQRAARLVELASAHLPEAHR